MYDQLTTSKLYRQTGYYGVPKNPDHDGLNGEDKLCSMYNRATMQLNVACKAMKKTYYNQYQYFAFYVAG